jgi:hypothetical protein
MSPRFPVLDSGATDNAEPRGRYAGIAMRYCRLDGGVRLKTLGKSPYTTEYEPSFMIQG